MSLRRSPAILGLAICALVAAMPGRAAEFTDSAGRHVDVPDHVARILPAGPPADVLLYSLTPDALVGLVEAWTPAQKPLVTAPARDLPKIPRLTGHPTDADLRLLRDLHADLIVDYGDITPGYAALADRIQANLGVPYLLLDGALAKAPDVLQRLGTALGRKDRGAELAVTVEDALSRLAPLAATPAEQRVAVYYARGTDGLDAVRAGSSLEAAMALAGAHNVVPPGKGAFVGMTIEDVAALHPAVVILADPTAAAEDSPLRKALPATTRFLVDPGLPIPWIENPPSLNRLVGALWLAAKLYPDRIRFTKDDAGKLIGALFHESPADAVLDQIMGERP